MKVYGDTYSCHTHTHTHTQANDMLNAILEGYPKSKKELYVSLLVPLSVFVLLFSCHQEEVGVETDEDCGVKLPSS